MSDLAVPVLLSQLAHEISALQRMVEDMEGAVDDIIERHAGVLDPRSIQNLQLLDIVGQSLVALSTFAAAAAALAPADWRIDGTAAISGIKLASLAQRLATGRGTAVDSHAQAYELFSDG